MYMYMHEIRMSAFKPQEVDFPALELHIFQVSYISCSYHHNFLLFVNFLSMYVCRGGIDVL